MPGHADAEDIKAELRAEVSRDAPDYGAILSLSSRLAQLDPDHMRFTVDAGIIGRLGRELVARAETAAAELIKNAYDADATFAELVFLDASSPGGRLEIRDDGIGMTREELVNGFMRLASRLKVHNPVSTRYRRRRAGRKGIGRFAAQRLGSRLTLTTQTKDAKNALRLEIDWTQFDAESDVGAVANAIGLTESMKDAGTLLEIEGLSDGWSDAALTRTYKYLAEVVQPFPLSKPIGRPRDPGFEVRILRRTGDEIVRVADADQMVYDYALAEISAGVDDSGRGLWSVKSDAWSLEDTDQPIGPDESGVVPFRNLRNARLRARYFIYDNQMPRGQESFIKKVAAENGGVRLYRNGFRVMPASSSGNDWLGLDESYGKRGLLFPHRNINFFGTIDVTDPEGRLLEETASREGLIHNDAYDELVRFARRVLVTAAQRVNSARAVKISASQRDWKKAVAEPPELQLREMVTKLVEAAETLQSEVEAVVSKGQDEAAGRTSAAAASVVEYAQAIGQGATDLAEEVAMLRVLASTGLVIAEFTHEIRHLFTAVEGEALHLSRLLQEDEGPRQAMGHLCSHLDSLRAYTSYFDRVVAANASREMRPQEMGVTLRNFHHVMNELGTGFGIEMLEPVVHGYDLFTCPMHASEWASILMNLFSNSRKAIDRAGVQGRILMEAGRTGDCVYVHFSDNGEGIDPVHQNRIFEPFFSTSSVPDDDTRDEDEVAGTGLGLTIVEKIVTAYRGDVTLVASPEGYTTCFRVALPAAGEEEVDES